MALSEEDKKEIGTLVADAIKGDTLSTQVNAAIRKIAPGIVKSELEPITKSVGKNGENLTSIQETLKTLADKESDSKSKGGKGQDSEVVQSLRKELDEVKARDKAREKETHDARSMAAETGKKSAFMTLASKHMRSGDIAYGHLKDRIVTGDEGFEVEVQRDGYKEKIPLEQFLTKEFLPSDEGSMFAPAKGAGGAGGRGGGSDRGDQDRGKGGDAEAEVDDLLSQAGWGN